MKTQTSNAVAYALDMLSFVFQNREAGSIRAVYLFGSAARGEMQATSDIDIFAECLTKDEKKVQRLLASGIIRFKGSLDYKKWKLLRWTYPFAVQEGVLQEGLQRSIRTEGIMLYGKSTMLEGGERKVLFTIEYPSSKKGYIHIRRMLFGRDEPLFRDKGLVGKIGGRKISSHVFLIPKEEQTTVMDVLAKEGVSFSMVEVKVEEG